MKSPKEDYQIPKDKILGVFQLKYWNTSKVRWYHKVFFGLLFLTFTLITFNILTTWMNQYEKLEGPSFMVNSLTAGLWALAGLFFIGLIILFLEVGVGMPGISGMLSRLFIGRTKRYVVIKRKTIEYQFIVNKRKAQDLEEKIKEMINPS